MNKNYLSLATLVGTIAITSLNGCEPKYNETEIIYCKTIDGTNRSIDVLKRTINEIEDKTDLDEERLAEFNYETLSDIGYYGNIGIDKFIEMYNLDKDLSEINTFDTRFTSEDKLEILRLGLEAEYVNSFSDKVFKSGIQIIEAAKSEVSPSKANAYEGYAWEDVIANVKSSFLYGVANKYEKRFKKNNVSKKLYDLGKFPDNVANYNKKFSGVSVLKFVESNISHKVTNTYNKNASAAAVMSFVKNKKPSSVVNAYYKLAEKHGVKFKDMEIPNIINKGISTSYFENGLVLANTEIQIAKRFKAADKVALDKAGLTTEEANEYNEVFKKEDILFFHKSGLSPNKVNKYGELKKKYGFELSTGVINGRINQGISFSQTIKDAKEFYVKKLAKEAMK